MQPAPRRVSEEAIAQTEHARLLSPACNAVAGLGSIKRQRTHDRKAAGIIPYRRECHLGRSGIPTRRMNDGSVDAGFIHQPDRFLWGEMRHLAVRHVARQAASPEVNLRVYFRHSTVVLPFTYCAAVSL